MADPEEEPLSKDRTHEVAMLQFGIRSAVAALLDLQGQGNPAVRTDDVRAEAEAAIKQLSQFVANQRVEKRRVRILRAV